MARANLLIAATALSACTASQGPVASASRQHEERPGTASAREMAAPIQGPAWRHLATSHGWPTSARYTTKGHHAPAGRARVRASATARGAYAVWTRGLEMPAGAILVQELVSEAAGIEAMYTMEKGRNGRWTYLVLDAGGRVMAGATSCETCHQQATSDQVFGPPRPTR